MSIAEQHFSAIGKFTWIVNLIINLVLGMKKSAIIKIILLYSLINSATAQDMEINAEPLKAIKGFIETVIEGSNELKGSNKINRLGIDILSTLNMVFEKNITEADRIAGKRLGELRGIFLELDQSIDKNGRIIDSAIGKLERLRDRIIKDIGESFEKIYGVLEHADCQMLGQLLSVEMIGNKLIEKVGETFTLRHVVLSRLPKDQGGIRPSVYYESMKKNYESNLNENIHDKPIRDIIYVYSDLSFLARRMQCLHRGSEAAEIYVRDFLEFEKKLAFWKSVPSQ